MTFRVLALRQSEINENWNSFQRNGDESHQSSMQEMNDYFGKTFDKICPSQPMELIKSPENCLCISSSDCARYIYLFVYKMTNHIPFREGT